jgi:hypothetical protein
MGVLEYTYPRTPPRRRRLRRRIIHLTTAIASPLKGMQQAQPMPNLMATYFTRVCARGASAGDILSAHYHAVSLGVVGSVPREGPAVPQSPGQSLAEHMTYHII